jgi:predicted dinucleotide-binding enzyme
MNIGIIGAGHIGGTTARLLAQAGHRVAISNSRGPETLRDLAAEIGAQAVTVEEAARFGDVVLVAVPLKEYKSVPADALRGKIVIDANNYYPDRDGPIAELDSKEKTSSELLAQHLGKDTRVVKAFNTIWVEHLKVEAKPDAPIDERRVLPISGDDADAKRVVTGLIEEIGYGAYDMGSLRDSGEQQPGAPLYNRDVTVAEARGIAPR